MDGAAAFNVTPPSSEAMHVSDLDGAGKWVARGSRWAADVTITVVDADGAPVSDATVKGVWDNQKQNASSCTTDETGQCMVTSPPNTPWRGAITFTVTDITHENMDYTPEYNSDPDGDSDGVSVVVQRPPVQ